MRWADELQGRQQQQLASGLQPLAEELQRLMRQHGVKPGSSDPTGLYGIRLQLTKERRYTLDRFENQNPQTGFSLVLPGGQLVMPAKAISDSGCTFSLVDKDWADSVGWRYRPTKIRLVLADNTCSRVTGITEPAWGMVAAGTPQEGRALMQALVVEGAGDTFQLAVGKEHLALHSACVLQDEQAFSYRSVTGERCTLPVTCYEEEPAAVHVATAREGRSRGYQIKETARVAALAPSLRQLSFGLVADSSQEVTAAMMECFEQPQTLQLETAEQQLGRGGAEGFTKTEAEDKDALGGTTAAVAEHNDLKPAVPGLSLGGDDCGLGGYNLSAGGGHPLTPEPFSGRSSSAFDKGASRTTGNPDPGKPAQPKVAPKASRGPKVSASKGLEMMGYGAPHFYFRGVAYMGSFMLWVLWFLWQSCSHTLQVLGVPLQDIEATCRLHGTSVCRWWQSRLEPAPAFMEPTSPRKPSRRWSSWHQEFLFRIQRGKLLPSSVRRHARRYTKAVQQYDRTTLQHQVVSIITGVSLKGLIPLLLLTLTCLLGQAAATPDLLQGIHLLTNSLAAWELAQLNKANFASAADYHDLARHTAGELRMAAAAHRFFNHCAMPAGTSGQQFSANKDSYEADPEQQVVLRATPPHEP